MKTYPATLLFTVKDDKIMLAMKKRGFGVGLFNGVGGKVEPGETVEQGLLREANEEVGITPIDYKEMARLYFDEQFRGERATLLVHVFTATSYKGVEHESEEMRPQWFDLDKIPYNNMHKNDDLWLPEILAERKIEGHFKLDDNMKMISCKLSRVKTLPTITPCHLGDHMI